MEISRRPPRRTPIQQHWRIAALHRNALPIASILSLVSFVQAGSLRAADIKIWQEFSGEKAFAHVQRLVDFGPRPVGSKAIEKARTYIDDQLRQAGWHVERQEFFDATPARSCDDCPPSRVRFVNLIARFPSRGKSAPSFLLCSHYDTKIFD